MKIENIKAGMKLRSKKNNLVEFYIVKKVNKSNIWVMVEDENHLIKNIKPYIMENF